MKNDEDDTMSLAELCIAHEQALFPRNCSRDIKGISLPYLDTQLSGCISSYLRHNKTTIDIDRYLILQKSKTELEMALPYLKNETFEYFSRLHQIAYLILEEASIS